MKKIKNIKSQSLIELCLVIILAFLLNFVLSNYFFRIDLTKENRFSLSNASKNLAAKVVEPMYVKVYLEGEFPADFKRLQRSVKEMLDEFSVYSNGNIQYEFIDPFVDANDKKSNDIIQELGGKGLQATSVQVKKDDEFSQKIIIPGALILYKQREIPLNLLKGQFGAAPEETINSSIELLEYEIANVLRKSVQTKANKLALLRGHGELEKWDIADGRAELELFYDVEDLDVTQVPPQTLNEYVGIIIAKPTIPFTDFDKFKIDQYIMNGGKVLWLMESQSAEMDSLMKTNMFFTSSFNHNLDDILFKYGVRINQNIVQDLQCEAIPILSGMKDGMPQQKLLPWVFYPVTPPSGVHPIIKNIDHVWFQFASSIDTIPNSKIKKTVLLQSSSYSRVVPAPVRIDLEIARLNPEPELFRTGGNKILAVLLEGEFNSIFQYRYDATKNPGLSFKEKIENGKMIVVSDGDIIKNQRKKTTGEIFPLGFNRFTQQQFGNKRFLLNCVDYLCDESGIIEIRSKEITLRQLDKAKVKKEKKMWQLVNIAVPIVLVLLFGWMNRLIRNKKYA